MERMSNCVSAMRFPVEPGMTTEFKQGMTIKFKPGMTGREFTTWD